MTKPQANETLNTRHKEVNTWQKDIPNDRMAHLVRDTARLLAKSLHHRLTKHEVSFGHWSFLRILWATEGLTQRELSERAGVMEPTTFTALKAMEGKGLIERRRLNGNQRKVYIYLTDKGHELKNTLTPLAEEVNSVALAGVSSSYLSATRQTLLAIIQNLSLDINQTEKQTVGSISRKKTKAR
jgi:DNA-binding MarR family transcriptional regulator